MSSFDGNRSSAAAPRFPADLNSAASRHDGPAPPLEGLAFEDDLAMFTNAHFFDFDLGETVNPAPMPEAPVVNERRPNATAGLNRPEMDQSGLEVWKDDFQLTDVTSFQTLLADPASAPLGPAPIQVPDVAYPMSSLSSPTAVSAKGSSASPRTGEKRKAEAVPDVSRAVSTSLEEASRLAAEEDKRRRNTAASARFRIKKKQREQTLERTAKEMTEKVSQLEAKIGQLETENKWLKNLITEKNGNKDEVTELRRRWNTTQTKDGTTIKTES